MILSGVLVLASVVSADHAGRVREALLKGDAHYARRAEGAQGGTADPAEIDAALSQYRSALALDPHSFDTRLRLLRGLYFRGGFCGLDAQGEMRVFDEAKALAEDTVRRLDAESGRVRGQVTAEGAAKVDAEADIYLWAAVSWGQWAVAHRLSAAWQGAPARIRDLSQAVLVLAPDTELGAAAHLILGRLHTEAPRIPMLTLWVSRAKGLTSLRAGLTIAPESPPNMFFLADALLTFDASKKDEARDLLTRCANGPARPAYLVEDRHYMQMAQERLAEIR